MKATWIKIKRGLLEPKHREQLGNAWFLYFYMLDRADWEQGAVLDWKDPDAAKTLTCDLETIRKHRRRLEEYGYITCEQKQYGQRIAIHNWTNPREYSGEVYNQGGTKQQPQNAQGGTQGGTQGIGERTTPTSSSQNHISHKDSLSPELEYEDVEDEGGRLKSKPKVSQSDLRQMVTAIASVTGYDLKIRSNWNKLGKVARELCIAGYKPAQVVAVFGKGGAWWTQTWQGKKDQPPSTKDVTTEIGRLTNTVRSTGETARDRLEGRLKRIGN